MNCKCSNKLLWLIIILGVLLRLTDVAFPDFATDEAQFALNASAAQPPIGMFFFWLAQTIFGASIISARAVSIAFGIATIYLIYKIVLEFSEKKAALTAAAFASIFPTHIIFSKLAYLSVPLCFAWALTTLMFIKANKKPHDSKLLIALFLSSVLATFIKTQGLLFPLLLLIGIIIESIKNKKPLFTIHYSLFSS
ncbi:MAG: glycosyltransferase family 39 protein [Candidatus Peribacteraceae bacterium]|nr:glycosyltransferase family 39 protein [Candidatus Peribacteraceae bacterium]